MNTAQPVFSLTIEQFTGLVNGLIQDAIKDNTNHTLQKENFQKRDWIPLSEFFKYSSISRSSWYREYQYKIKYRDDGVKIWVNIPSYESYLEEKAINKKPL